ncbi:YcnI family protein [Cellulomonas algicola]|uniref:YcnI family protein n=1 Tax=Cellulomonas algicola TaxID=2071633 RepID=UPI001C3FCCE9|nr:YcnI family protein [Cellulomonas algicola]
MPQYARTSAHLAAPDRPSDPHGTGAALGVPVSARRGQRSAGAARLAGRVAAVAALGLGAAVLPSAADAHVRVIPESTVAGGWSALTFRVPNESATAVTTQVVVDLPTDTPFLYVSTRPVPGWTATVEKAPLDAPVDSHGTTITEAPARVTWTATPGAEIGDGQFQEFAISAGPLPEEVGLDLVLPAHQSYSDGTVVDWDEVAGDGGEPEHPAPVFTTTAAPGDDAAAADDATAAPVADVDASGAATGTADEQPDTVARVLGGVGLLLGLAALVVAVVTSRRRGGTA